MGNETDHFTQLERPEKHWITPFIDHNINVLNDEIDSSQDGITQTKFKVEEAVRYPSFTHIKTKLVLIPPTIENIMVHLPELKK